MIYGVLHDVIFGDFGDSAFPKRDTFRDIYIFLRQVMNEVIRALPHTGRVCSHVSNMSSDSAARADLWVKGTVVASRCRKY